MKIFKLRFLLAIFFVCYLASLALPGLVYKPDVRANPKYEECASAVQPQTECLTFTFGTTGVRDCRLVDNLNPEYRKEFMAQAVSKEEILNYCDGYDQPVPPVDYGFMLLLGGFMGVFVGMFAWFANPAALLALVFLSAKKFKYALALTLVSVSLGLQSFLFVQKPLDEGASRWYLVDHLGAGFYLWEASLVILCLYCYLRLRESSWIKQKAAL